MLLLNLPSDLFREIVCKWLQMLDCYQLDSSVVNEGNRNSLLNCFKDAQFWYTLNHNTNVLYWIKARHIKVNRIKVHSCIPRIFWSIDFTAVKDLSIYLFDTDIIVKLVHLCKALTSLTLISVRRGSPDVVFDHDAFKNISYLRLEDCNLHLLQALACQTRSLKHFKSICSDWIEDFESTLLTNNQKTLRSFHTSSLFNPTLFFSKVNIGCRALESLELRCVPFPATSVAEFFNCHSTATSLKIKRTGHLFWYEKSATKDTRSTARSLTVKRISGLDLAAVVTALPKDLNEVHLESVDGLSDATLQSLSTRELTNLHISNSFSALSAGTLRNFLLTATKLMDLSINCCDYSEEDLHLVLSPALTNWKYVDIRWCPSVGEATIESMLESTEILLK